MQHLSIRRTAHEPKPALPSGLVVSRVEHGNLARAYQEAEALVRRRPDTPDAHFSLSYVLRFAGLLEESASHCETAFLLDSQTPSLTLRSCAMVFLLRGAYPHALNYLNLDRGSDFAKALSIDLLLREGKEQEALQVGAPQNSQWAGYDMLLAYLQHKPEPEISALARAMRASEDPETNYLSAAHLSYAGFQDPAAQMLREAIKGNYCSYPAVETDPLFTKLRTTPEFADIRAAAIKCRDNFLSQR